LYRRRDSKVHTAFVGDGGDRKRGTLYETSSPPSKKLPGGERKLLPGTKHDCPGPITLRVTGI
jgi:hypothetical protein